jgi:hypothetical protein
MFPNVSLLKYSDPQFNVEMSEIWWVESQPNQSLCVCTIQPTNFFANHADSKSDITHQWLFFWLLKAILHQNARGGTMALEH